MLKKSLVILFLMCPFFISAKSVTVSVPGMVCQMCLQGMKTAFKDSVNNPDIDVHVNLDTKMLTLNLAKHLSDSEIRTKIKNAGYNAENITR